MMPADLLARRIREQVSGLQSCREIMLCAKEHCVSIGKACPLNLEVE